MTIIIEIPQPACRARLVLAHVSPCASTTCCIPRDATPADLERAGWVASVGDGSFDAVCDVIQRAHRVLHTEPGADLVRECARVWREGCEAVERAEKAERERNTLRAELARLRPDGVDEPLDVELEGMVAQAKRDNETGRHVVSPLRVVFRAGVAHERARQTAKAKGHSIACSGCGLRSPSTPDEDDVTDVASDAGWQVNGVNDYTEDMCPRCQQARQPEKDRATDEELVSLYAREYDAQVIRLGERVASLAPCRRAAVSAVAARVRQERCLVAQAVGMGAGFSAEPGEVSYGVVVLGSAPPPPEGMPSLSMQAYRKRGQAHDVAPADVPATLARLLGEVARG